MFMDDLGLPLHLINFMNIPDSRRDNADQALQFCHPKFLKQDINT
jgi:hypothetical protein